MSTKQIPKYDPEEIGKKITEVIDKKFTEIEKKLPDMMGSILDDKMRSLDLSRRRLDDPKTLEIIKNSFDDMEFVRQVHYLDAGDELRLIIIHDHAPSTSGFSAISSRVSGVSSSTDRYDITPWILHESEILPHHMRGAKLLFERPQKPKDAAGMTPDGRPRSDAPGRPDDPEALEIIKNSFDDMEFVRQVYYRYDDEGFLLFIIHDSEHFNSAHSAICNRIVKIEDSLHDVFIRNWIMPESELAPRHLVGAKILFKR